MGELAPDQRLGYDLAQRYRELNTILGRLRRRRYHEPTVAERERLAVLRAEIASLKRSGTDREQSP